MFKKVNSNKNGVIEYAIDDVEDLDKLPRKETDNTVYATLNKNGKRLIYLYSKVAKDYILINGDLEEINEQLDNINEQLDTKADITYVDNRVNNIVSGSPKGIYATLSDLQREKPNGDVGIYITQDNGNWNFWNGTSWIEGGVYTNTQKIATKSELARNIDGEYIMYRGSDFSFTEGKVLTNTGTISTNGALNATLQGVTDYIDVEGFTHIECLLFKNDGLATAALAFFDTDNNLLSVVSNNTYYESYVEIPIPSLTKKIIYCYYIDSRADSKGVLRLSYIKLKNINSLLKKTEKNTSELEKLYVKSNNLFNPNDEDIIFDKQLSPVTIVDDTTKNISGFIPCKKGDIFYFYPTFKSQSVWIYDENKEVLDKSIIFNTSNACEVTVDNACYFRINILKNVFDKVNISTSKILNFKPTNLINDELLNKNNTNINWWYGKKGDSLGDSLTGQGFFQKYVSMYYNLDSFKNSGIGGSKLSGEDVDSTRPSMWKDSRINALREDADFITILGGQNDGDVEIGEISKTNMDTNTYVGAYNTIIDKIYKKYNGLIQIILCTPFYVPSEGDNGERFIKLDKAVKEIGQLHGLPVADFGGMSGANKYVKDIYWGDDKTHPIENFYRDKIAPILIETMDKIKPINFEITNSIEYSITQ